MSDEAGGHDTLHLATEQVRDDVPELDGLDADELVSVMATDARRASDAVLAARSQIALAVAAVAARMERGGRLIYVGAGTAGRLGVLDAAEAGPTFSVPSELVSAVLAGGSAAFARSSEAAEDDRSGALRDLERLALGSTDSIVGLTASGRTPFVIGALEWARARGALTVSVACNTRAAISAVAELPIELDVGGEVLAGSTRLNAGTAQKITLNILSTSVMVLLGRTYRNRMVDMRATNEKLRHRARRIVCDVTGADDRTAIAALEASDWDSKLAIAMIAADLDPVAARALLQDSKGRLRLALETVAAQRPERGPLG